MKMIIYDDLTILLWWNIIKNKSYKVPQKVSPLRMNLPHGVPTAVAITGTSISFTHHLHTKIQSCLCWLSRTNKKNEPQIFFQVQVGPLRGHFIRKHHINIGKDVWWKTMRITQRKTSFAIRQFLFYTRWTTIKQTKINTNSSITDSTIIVVPSSQQLPYFGS